VWVGNDDNRPMRGGVTGGHQAAPIWHDLMTVAHTDMNIATIPGLIAHPRQIEEQQRVAALKAAQVAAGGVELPASSVEPSSKPQSIMPEKTRDALKTLAMAMRKASGSPALPVDPPKPEAPPVTNKPPDEKHADGSAALGGTPADDFDMSRD